MGYTSKLIYREDCIRKDNTVHILLRVTIDRITARYKTGVFIEPNKWDKIHQRIRGYSPLVIAKNQLLQTINVKVTQTFNHLIDKNLPVNHENFRKIFTSNSSKRLDFYELWQQYIDSIDGNLASGTVAGQKSNRVAMMRFRKELDVHEINYSLMSEYEKYMRNEVKNKDSTIHRTIRRIHVVLNYLVKNEIIEKNPVKGFYVKDKPSMKVHLLDEELKAFEQLYHRGFLDTEEKKNVYSYFLFACYTGLRHSDINILKFKDIVMMKDKSCINLKMQKTKEIVTIPLIAKAKNLIGRYKGKDELVFDSYYNAKTNKILRGLITDARIDKHITFHSARHTFGTIAYNLGMPLGVIQKLMGHKNYKETLIYSKILDKTLFKEMEKME